MGSVVLTLQRNPRAARLTETAQRMLRASPHRGPRLDVLLTGRCAVGASTDERADAMLARQGDWAAAVTGRLELLAGSTNCAETALAVVRNRGVAGLSKLRGVFAGVVTDGLQAWAFRDQVGFAPLFYRRSAGEIFVATEPKQVLTGTEEPKVADLEVVEAIFWGERLDETTTSLKGVRRLPKASWLASDGERFTTGRYWDPTNLLESAPLGEADLRERFEAVMSGAVERALAPDAAVALSGGIDSPAIAAFAAPRFTERFDRPMVAVSAVYPDLPTVDESTYIELAAGSFGMNLHSFRPTAGPLDGLAHFARLCDGPAPTVSLAESAELYRKAREVGCRTILTGEMAEFVIAMGGLTLQHLVRRGRVGRTVAYLDAERRRGVPPATLVRRLVRAGIPSRWLAWRRWRAGSGKAQGIEWLDRRRLGTRSSNSSPSWASQQLSGYLGAGLSLEADEFVQAACGVRVHRPWLDVDLWELFLRLPAHQKYPNGRDKALVKELLRGRVPDEILDRRTKTYFDDSFFARIDYQELRRWLSASEYRMPGVDYQLLDTRLAGRSLGLIELMWAKDLANIHAFVSVHS